MLTAGRLFTTRIPHVTTLNAGRIARKAVRPIAGEFSQRYTRRICTTSPRRKPTNTIAKRKDEDADGEDTVPADEYTSLGARDQVEHAVISAFDLFSIGGALLHLYHCFRESTILSVGPSSSHTVGPMRAGKIFINDLLDLGLLEKVCKLSRPKPPCIYSC